MEKLSVVIITFNEEKNIGRCISSVKSIADEIVVVDSFSSDNTRKICQENKVHFIEHKFEGHIEQKNWALEQASNDFVLSLDADEALSPELEQFILKEKQHFRYDAYLFNRLTNYCGKWIRHGGWYPDKKLRLFNKNKAKWAGMNPHDQCIAEKGSAVKRIRLDILHYSFHSISDHILQIEKFTSIMAQSKFHKGNRAGWLKLIFSPAWKFFNMFFIRLGILDGYKGFLVARNSAFASFLKSAKLRELHQ
jgi:glycosyltransferase involved in cell wall biosynthesis